ncbi:MAG: hypothetical protein ABL876_03755 [Chitinophagaceae bacterium]
MRTVLFILLLLCQVIFFSCKQKEDDAAVPNEYAAGFVRKLNTSDTFRYEFPFYYSRRSNAIDSTSYYSKINSERWLGLSSLEKGFDSVQIRVSYGCALMSEWMMIILKHDGHKWTAEVSRVKDYFNEQKAMVDSMSRKVKFDKPISGWKAFINMLFELKILIIEDDKTVIQKEDYPSVADGCGIAIELATRNAYRFYAYGDPTWAPEKYWQSANIEAIKKLLLKEFEVLKEMDKEMNDDWHNMIKQNKEKRAQDQKNPVRKDKVVEITIQDVVDTPSVKKKGRN